MYLVLMTVLTVLVGIFVLFIVSFLPIKGIFVGENVEIQEGTEKKTKVAQIPSLINSCC